MTGNCHHALRNELETLLYEFSGSRRPALKRSRKEDWLYATDLGTFAAQEQIERFVQRAEASGWEILCTEDWIDTRKVPDCPPDGWHPVSRGVEARCCLSLLERHVHEGKDRETVISLIKAGEKDSGEYEKVCRNIHCRWSELLRQGKPLPDISKEFFMEETVK